MALRYPKNPRFNRLQMRTPDYTEWQEGCAHDPSLLEHEGKYYAFSTDTFGAPGGYQIRVSAVSSASNLSAFSSVMALRALMRS